MGIDYPIIGQRIQRLRRQRGMTQEQLANEVGVVVMHISHIETGNSVPSLKKSLRKVYGKPSKNWYD